MKRSERKRLNRNMVDMFGATMLTAKARERGMDIAEVVTGTRGTVRRRGGVTGYVLEETTQAGRWRETTVTPGVWAVTVEPHGVRRRRQDDQIEEVTVRYEEDGRIETFTRRVNSLLVRKGDKLNTADEHKLFLGDWPDAVELFGEAAE